MGTQKSVSRVKKPKKVRDEIYEGRSTGLLARNITYLNIEIQEIVYEASLMRCCVQVPQTATLSKRYGPPHPPTWGMVRRTSLCRLSGFALVMPWWSQWQYRHVRSCAAWGYGLLGFMRLLRTTSPYWASFWVGSAGEALNPHVMIAGGRLASLQNWLLSP